MTDPCQPGLSLRLRQLRSLVGRSRGGDADIHPQIKMRIILDDPLLRLSADYPSTSESLMVWSDNRRGYWNIYGFDFFSRTEKPISRADANQLYPKASGNRVVWQDDRGGRWEIYMKDTASVSETAVAPGMVKGDQTWPSISGDKVVLMDNSSGNWDIYMSDLEAGTKAPLRKGPGQQMYPAISGNLVVWQGNRKGNWDRLCLRPQER